MIALVGHDEHAMLRRGRIAGSSRREGQEQNGSDQIRNGCGHNSPQSPVSPVKHGDKPGGL